MCQRVMIAMALSCEPQLVLADEPTTALDVSVQAQILELLRTVIARHGTALMMITHDLSVVAGLADRVAVMYAGEIVELAPSERLFAHPRHPYTASLLDCITRLDDVRTDTLPAIPGAPPDLTQPRSGCPFAPRCALAQPVCAERPPLAEKAPAHKAACFFDIPAPAPRAVVTATPEPEAAPDGSAGVVLDVRDLKVHFKRGGLHIRPRPPVRAVDGISFEVRRGETLGLVGEFGLGQVDGGQGHPSARPGDRRRGAPRQETISGKRERALKPTKRRLQMVLQDPYGSLNPRMTITEIVAEPLTVHDVAPGEASRRATELLELVGLPRISPTACPTSCPAASASASRSRGRSHWTPVHRRRRADFVARRVGARADPQPAARHPAARPAAYLFISHDLGVVRHMSDHVAVMYLGRLVEIGDRETIFGAPQHPYTRGLLEAVPVPDPAVERSRRRTPLTGEVPSAADPPRGCNFNTRCPFAFDRCFEDDPSLTRIGGTHLSACHLAAPKQSETYPESLIPTVTGVAKHRRTKL